MTLSPGYQARGADGQVHVVVDGGAVLDAPSRRTLCGTAVLVVYEHQVGTTCPECSRWSWPTEVLVSFEPCG